MIEPPPLSAAPKMLVEIVDPEQVSAPAIEAWYALVADAAEPNSFMEPWFLLPSLQHLRGDGTVRLLFVWRAALLQGVIALGTSWQYGRMRAHHTLNWQSMQSFYGAPLVRKGAETEFWATVIDTLDQALWAANFLRILAVDTQGPVLMGLNRAAAQISRPCPIVHRQTRALSTACCASWA